MKRGQMVPWLVAADAAAAVTAFLLAWLVRFHLGAFAVTGEQPPFAPYLNATLAAAILWPVAYSSQRLYRHLRRRSLAEETVSMTVGSLLAAVLLFGSDAYYRIYHLTVAPSSSRFQFSRLYISLAIGFAVIASVALRMQLRRRFERLRLQGQNVRRVLVVGAGELGQQVATRMLSHPELGYLPVGYVDDEPCKKGRDFAGITVLGTTDDVPGLTDSERVDQLLLALPWSAHDTMLRLLADASKEGLDVKVVPDILQFVSFRASLEDLDGIPLLDLGEDPLGPWDRIKKRAFDMVVATLGLALTSPLLAVIAIVVKRSSPGPVLYRQERTGLDGDRFVIFKFRTMPVDAEVHTGPVFADDDDPRATPAGAWLRNHSLDELPQLWNVLSGEMSLIGPRPERPSFVSEFKETIPRYMLRHKMKSGMTGWAQIHGFRGNTSIAKRLEYDLFYVRNWSLGLDLKILWMTVLHELRRSRGDDKPR